MDLGLNLEIAAPGDCVVDFSSIIRDSSQEAKVNRDGDQRSFDDLVSKAGRQALPLLTNQD